MEIGECKLCKQQAELQLSHILPAFAFKWQKASSGNGHLRSTQEPNARVQDGIKKYWLCTSCEQLFSKSEQAFATQLFHPYLEHSGQNFSYAPWLLHFCVSVSWRVLALSLEVGNLQNWSDEELNAAKGAEIVWREFLLGKRPHPGSFRQHLVPMDEMADAAGNFPPNINRYFLRAIAMDVCRAPGAVFTYGKLGRFMIFGAVMEKHPENWIGTKVNANEGVVGPRSYNFPYWLHEYWNRQAQKVSGALESVSLRQQQKIEDAFRANIDRYSGCDAFVAMQADVSMFGDDAFTKK